MGHSKEGAVVASSWWGTYEICVQQGVCSRFGVKGFALTLSGLIGKGSVAPCCKHSDHSGTPWQSAAALGNSVSGERRVVVTVTVIAYGSPV
jgi:hypothetical protein